MDNFIMKQIISKETGLKGNKFFWKTTYSLHKRHAPLLNDNRCNTHKISNLDIK